MEALIIYDHHVVNVFDASVAEDVRTTAEDG